MSNSLGELEHLRSLDWTKHSEHLTLVRHELAVGVNGALILSASRSKRNRPNVRITCSSGTPIIKESDRGDIFQSPDHGGGVGTTGIELRMSSGRGKVIYLGGIYRLGLGSYEGETFLFVLQSLNPLEINPIHLGLNYNLDQMLRDTRARSAILSSPQ